MELYQLKAFCMIAETGNLTRASKRLYTTQPAVSMQLAKLEEEWGVRLFERSHQGMKLTPEGEELFAKAQDLLGQSREVEDLAKQLSGEARGLLRIAVVNGGAGLRIPEILEDLNQVQTSILPSVGYGYSLSIREGVLSGELDVGIIEDAVEDALLECVPITSTPLGIAVPARWRNELQDSSDWKVLEKYPWVFNSDTCAYARIMDRLMQKHELKLQRKFLMDMGDASLDFVNRGMALSLIDRRMVTEEGNSFLWPHYEQDVPVSLIYLKSKKNNTAIKQFCQSATRTFGV
ncbi:MAG: LysR family transcriptional regulator [Gammaproteobacteria bacterium]|nr:LysR family transcriptional regulator [Gammaproteobacteria bacterium]